MIKTLKKIELLELLAEYPNDTRIEMTVHEADLEECRKNGNAIVLSDDGCTGYVLGISNELSYSPEEKTIALPVWSKAI